MGESRDLVPLGSAAIEPTAFVDIMDWLNVHAIVEGEREASNVIAFQNILDLLSRELAKCYVSGTGRLAQHLHSRHDPGLAGYRNFVVEDFNRWVKDQQ